MDSRDVADGTVVRRRRACRKCRRRFTTYERAEPPALFVKKKDGRREPFDREKIRRGVLIACAKRPVPLAEIDDLVARVELACYRGTDREIPSSRIGDLVVRELRRLDHVAYVRFASVYRNFQDVSEFMKEVRPILR